MSSIYSSIKANEWTHVVVTWNRQQRTACLRVNNEKETQQVSVDAIDLPPMKEKFFTVGSGDINLDLTRYKGYIRDVKLFEKALSDSEVETIKGMSFY